MTTPGVSIPRALPVAKCRPMDANRALDAEDPALDEMADSIRVVGLLHPIHVRPVGDEFEIVAGVRRWLAHQRMSARVIPGFVHDPCDDVLAEKIRFIENDHRVEASAFDTARALRRIKNEKGLATNELLAAETGVAVARVKRYMSLFRASLPLLKAIETHRLPVSLAVELVRYEQVCGEAAARPLIGKAVAGTLTVRDIEARRSRKAALAERGKGRTARDPWQALERQVRALVAKDPTAARGRLAALLAQLGDQLPSAAA